MPWIILLLSGALEAVWATALDRSDGLTRPGWTVLFAVTAVVSLVGLSIAMRDLPLGTAYAVWVGVGASLTVAWAMISGAEPFSVVRVALLAGLIACIAGLKLTH